MSKPTLSSAQRADRLTRRAAAREEQATKVTEQREWVQARAAAAKERSEKKSAAIAKARAAKVDPNAPTVTVTPYLMSKTTERKPGRALVHGVSVGYSNSNGTIVANHADRRKAGQRSKRRPLRTRELPGAVARRVAAARKEWAAVLSSKNASA